MRAVVDLDGVLFDFMSHWAQRHPDSASMLRDVALPQKYGSLGSLSGYGEVGFWDWYRSTGGFRNCPWIPGAHGALLGLALRSDIDVILATNRPTWALEATAASIDERAYSAFYIGPDKTQLDADVWVDDNPAVLRDVTDRGHMAVRYWQPWNDIEHNPEMPPDLPTIGHLAMLPIALEQAGWLL